MTVRVRTPNADIELVDARRASPADRARSLPVMVAMHRVSPFLRRPDVARGVEHLIGSRGLPEAVLARRLEDRLVDRSVIAVTHPPRHERDWTEIVRLDAGPPSATRTATRGNGPDRS
jgi:hypothetical protein